MLSSSLGVVSELVPSMSGLTSAVSDGANMFASVTAVLPGTIGKLVGGVLAGAAAAAALKDAFFDWMSGIKDLERRAEESKAEFSKLNDAISQYTSTFEQLTNAMADASTDFSTIKKLEEKLADIIKDLPTELGKRLTEAVSMEDLKVAGENIRAGKTQECRALQS